MSDGTNIEWTNATWNPITGCTLVSEGCRNCYAAELAVGRLQHHHSREGLARRNADGAAKFTGEVRFNAGWLDQPLRWTKPRRIFVCAHGDLFHEGVPDAWIDRVFAVMALSPQHVFQVLTKRPERMREYLKGEDYLNRTAHERVADVALEICPLNLTLENAICIDPSVRGSRAVSFESWALPNVWLGVSVEDQATADERIPLLLDTPAAKRWISAEPLLGPLSFRWAAWQKFKPEGRTGHLDGLERLDWVVVGGESGRGARPMHPDWVRSLRDQCAAAGVPFFFKQWGAWSPHTAEIENAAGEIETTPKGGVNWYSWDGGVSGSFRVGKKAAGHLLDGVEHRAFPS